jgi:periodic tryptophan protein 1
MVKVWDVRNGKPTMVVSREVGAGKVFNLQLCPDSLFNLAACGTSGGLRIWDVSTNGAVRRTFSDRATFPDEEDVKDVSYNIILKSIIDNRIFNVETDFMCCRWR